MVSLIIAEVLSLSITKSTGKCAFRGAYFCGELKLCLKFLLLYKEL